MPAAISPLKERTTMATLLYQGHGSFRLTCNDGTIVYIDPFGGNGYDLPADLILNTHDHPDHVRYDKMPHAEGCQLIVAKDFFDENGAHKTINTKGLTITAVDACNENHPITSCVGLVIDVDGVRLYDTGDTSTTDDMRSGRLAAMELDYALICGDGIFNMDIPEASRCAEMIGARHTIPMHLLPADTTCETNLFSPERAEAFTGPGKLVLTPGTEIELR